MDTKRPQKRTNKKKKKGTRKASWVIQPLFGLDKDLESLRRCWVYRPRQLVALWLRSKGMGDAGPCPLSPSTFLSIFLGLGITWHFIRFGYGACIAFAWGRRTRAGGGFPSLFSFFFFFFAVFVILCFDIDDGNGLIRPRHEKTGMPNGKRGGVA